MENTRWAFFASRATRVRWFGREVGGATEGPADRYSLLGSAAKGFCALVLRLVRSVESADPYGSLSRRG